MRILLIICFLIASFGSVQIRAADRGSNAPGPAPEAARSNPPPTNSMWMPTGDPTLRFNFVHPTGWAMFIDPRTHAAAHAALMNPATYAQFMQPQWWMQFANPNNWMAWMNPASYATFMNPTTYMGWMNPAPYMHFINPAMYMQMMNPAAYAAFMNPATYLQWLNPAAYALPGGQTGTASFNGPIPTPGAAE